MTLPTRTNEKGSKDNHDKNRTHTRKCGDQFQYYIKKSRDHLRDCVTYGFRCSADIAVNRSMIVRIVSVELINLVDDVLNACILA
ncbi:hypothetical protein D3C78_1291510 [compost metagenome]